MNALKTRTLAALASLALASFAVTFGTTAQAADAPAAKSADKPAAATAEHKVKKARTPQQEKMSVCSKEAKGKKGDERRAFMHTCLSSHGDAAAAPAAKPASAKK